MNGPSVLLIEDEAPLRSFLRATLTSNGYRLVEATTAREGLALAASHQPELVLLDLGLPDGDGIDVTRRLREWMRAPIIVLSARGKEEDKVLALDAGADDYLTKPFASGELMARIRVGLRHARAAHAQVNPLLEFGALLIDLEQRRVTVAGQEIHLTPTEYRLLALLAGSANKVLTHRHLLRELWGPNTVQTHYLRVHMAELRRKIEPDPARPRWLTTEPGIGYRLRTPE